VHKTYFKSDILPAKKPKKVWRPGPRKATGERAVFEFVWMTRAHNCEICGRSIPIPHPWVFAHRFSKGVHGGERLNPNGIALACSLKCHSAVDAMRKFNVWPKVAK
jgi:hypothetical protein